MEKIRDFFKKVIGILGFHNTLGSLGIKPAVSDIMTAEITKWRRAYAHGDSLSLPASISTELARLVTLEFKTEISGSERAEYLNKSYQEFIKNIRTNVESAAALGGVMFKPYIYDGKIYIDCVQAERFVPTAVDPAGNIISCAFLDRIFKGKKYYTRIEEHTWQDGMYVVRNNTYVSDTEASIGRRTSLSEINEWGKLQPETYIKGIKRPLFSYFKMPMANRFDADSPLGISVFSGAMQLIADANRQYERLLWEFESGERAVYADETAFKTDKNGQKILPDKRLYRLLNSEELFEEWTPTLREENLIKGLNEILRKIEFNTGLAYGTLSDAQDVDKTAEEIKSSKQRSYSTVSDIQAALKTALLELCEVLEIFADLYGLCPEGEYSVSFDFDDSIIADRKTEFEEKMRLVSLGILKPWELRSWYMGEDEETAKANVMGGEPEGPEE